MQDFGGLEEYAIELAACLKKQGDDITIYCTEWTPSSNQYRRRINEAGISLVQIPKWLSLPASDWVIKEQLLALLTSLATPLALILAFGLRILRGWRWRRSLDGAHGWIRGRLNRFTSPDRRQPLVRLMLTLSSSRRPPHVIHVHGYTSNLLFVIDWAHRKGVPIVYEEHQTPDSQFDWWQDFHKSINKATRILACSDKSASALRQVCGASRPIVPRPPLCPDPHPEGWSAPSVKSPDDTPVITTVARLSVTKGLKYLLEAIVYVRASHPGAVFRVYGEGALRTELLAYASGLGLDGETIFVGAFEREQLAPIMQQTDIWVSSSILEGQSLALVEAMAHGCAIVSTDVGGAAELIQHDVNGLLCPRADAEALARSIRRLIESPTLRQTLRIAARKSFERGTFQPEQVSNFIRGVYNQAVAEYPSSVP
jgi:glycosyltransferase involved in cell wall biosynthesis